MVLMFRKAIALALAMFALAACGRMPSPEPSDGRLQIVVAFYPLQYAAERIGGDQVDITNLTSPGVEPHDLELTPQQVVQLQQADLVMYIPGFQPSVDQAVAANATSTSYDASTGISLLTTSTGSNDPHIWLNPMNMSIIASGVSERLTALRPDRTIFAKNLTSMATDMNSLNDRWQTGTTNCANRDLVVSHEAFGYLAKQYNFVQRGISGLSPDAEPAPATVAAVADFVKANNVKTIYFETLVDPKIANVLAAETGSATAKLDPLEGLADPATNYVSVMNANLASVKTGQPCQ